MNRLWAYVHKNIRWFIGDILLAAVVGYTKSYGTFLVGDITDALSLNDFSRVPFLALCAIGFHLTGIIFNLAANYIESYVSRKFAAGIRVELFNHISRASYIKLEKFKTGDLQSAFRNDINQASNVFELSCLFIAYSFMLIFELIFLSRINAMLTALVFVASVLTGVVTQGFLKVIKRYETDSRADLGAMSQSVLNMYNSADTIKMYSAQEFVTRIFNKRRDSYNKNLLGSSMADMFRLILYIALNNGAHFGCIIYLCYAAIRGEISVGEVLAYSSLLGMMFSHVDCIFRRLAPFMASLAAWERVQKLFDLPLQESADTSMVVSAIPEHISIDNISFNYDEDNQIFKNLSLHFKKGLLYAITGGSGSGKTTLLKILLGFYESPDMKVKINDQPAETGLAGLTGYVPSDNPLFNISIYDNIALGEPSVTRERCLELAGQIGFREWIESLPDGIDTIVAENAQNLSGGQRQALCVLRALAAERPVLIMDEPFAALDTDKEAALLDTLTKIKEDRVVIVTSHRRSSVMNCDTEIAIS